MEARGDALDVIPEARWHGIGTPAKTKVCQGIPVAAEPDGEGVVVQVLALGVTGQERRQEERVRLDTSCQPFEGCIHGLPWRSMRFWMRSLICLTRRRCSSGG